MKDQLDLETAAPCNDMQTANTRNNYLSTSGPTLVQVSTSEETCGLALVERQRVERVNSRSNCVQVLASVHTQ
jgi:hypothetical protein